MAEAALSTVLQRSRALGFLGPGPVDAQLGHSAAFIDAWNTVEPAPPRRVLDLGSGGGLPGLTLISAWPTTPFVLLEASGRRCDFLEEAIRDLACDTRAVVARGRAEALARTELRGTFSLVVARGFGPPAVTAECAVGFLEIGGYLAIADSPGADPSRWPMEPLASLGLAPAARVVHPASITVLRLERSLPESWPRRIGLPAKRPLWRCPTTGTGTPQARGSST